MKTLFGCCLIHLCIGSIYALSVLYTPIVNLTGWGISTLIYGFALTILSLGLTASFHQRLFPQASRKLALHNAILLWTVSNSLLIIAANRGNELIYYAISIILGFAIGLLYVIPINIITEYGYEKVGRANGLVVCCFGMGSIIASKIFSSIPLDNLIFIYVAYGVIMFVAVQLLPSTTITPSTAFSHDKRWYMIAGIFFLNIGIGISLLSNLAQLSITQGGVPMDFAILIVACAGVANSVGRIFYSSLSDYFDRLDTLNILLFVQFFSLITMWLWNMWTVPVLVIISIYGGVFSIMPSLMKELYKDTTAYSHVLSMWGFAGLICPIVFNQLGMPTLILMSSCTLILMGTIQKMSVNK